MLLSITTPEWLNIVDISFYIILLLTPDTTKLYLVDFDDNVILNETTIPKVKHNLVKGESHTAGISGRLNL